MSKRNISYVQQEEPAFLKRFKEKVGYKEGPDVNTKRLPLPPTGSDDEQEDGADEKPVVVVLKKGDLTAEEADNLLKKTPGVAPTAERTDEEEELCVEEVPCDGRVMFKKPVKKTTDTKSELQATTKKSSQDSKKDKHKASSMKQTKNRSLLSFDDEEDEDEEDV